MWAEFNLEAGDRSKAMNAEIKIWEIDGEAAEQVKTTHQAETERRLEDVLVRNPEMLMPGLTLVGRQTPADTGALDLLGVDRQGRLVVFELKRGKVTRDAVAQAIDYCSHLESLEDPELASHISKCSGNNGIDKIEDFESWYREQYGGEELAELRPIRMTLVGLGADPRAYRMVEFLAERGLDVSLLTFHGYQCGDRLLLARQVEKGAYTLDVDTKSTKSRPRERELRNLLTELAKNQDMEGIWEDAVTTLDFGRGFASKSGVTFYMPRLTLHDVTVSGSHSVVLDQKNRKIRVTFFPGAVDVCWKIFDEKKTAVPFKFETPPNARQTQRVSEQWYCVLNEEEWEQYKCELAEIASRVDAAWKERVQSAAAAP